MSILTRFELTNKVAIVTGASSGLGVAFAIAIAEAGGDVALGARRVDRLKQTEELITSMGRRSLSLPTDVQSPEDCRALAQLTYEQFGRLDILVNCAGIGTAVPATRETPDEFRSVIETNLMGSYWMAQACVRYMQPGASIINVASVLALTSVGLPQAAYTSSKAGIIGLTRDLAQQWSGRKGIRVNVLAPGYFPTEMMSTVDTTVLGEILERRVPMHRLGQLEECAAAVVFLASDAASFITGVCLPVDGGLLTM